MTFVDGKPLNQIAGTVEKNPERWNGSKGECLDDMVKGSFFYDEKESKLYAWLEDDETPDKHMVETYSGEYRGILIGRKLGNITVKDVKLVYCGVAVHGNYAVVENVEQSWAPFVGCHVAGKHCLILNSKFDWNGNSGMGGYEGTGTRIVDCQTNHNNWRMWSGGWHAGGVKFIASDSWVLQGHKSAYNNGDGIWFDIGRAHP